MSWRRKRQKVDVGTLKIETKDPGEVAGQLESTEQRGLSSEDTSVRLDYWQAGGAFTCLMINVGGPSLL